MRLKDIFRNLNFMFIFFGLFVYFMFIFDPSLYYHHHQPIFLFTHFFLKEFLFYPGGFIEWIMQFILQFFYFKWLGSLILAICVTSIFFIIFKLFKKLRYSKYTLVLSFLPIILLLILQNNYNFPVLITFKYLVVLLLFLIYKISQKQFKIMVILFSTVIYYILGGWFFLFYTLICILYELLFIKEPVKYLYTVLNAAMYLICPYIGSQYLFMITREEAYLYMVPYEFYYPPFTFKPNFYFFSFFLSLPVLLTIIFIYGRYIRLTFKSRKNKLFSILNHPLAQPVFIILIAGLIVNFSFNKQEKYKIQIDRCADQGQWQELLELAQKTTEYDREINFNVNRALYHTGQLLDNLFSYNQRLGTDGLFIDKVISSQYAIPASDLYFDLGEIKASQIMAYEGQTKFKYNPRILKRLVLTNIISDNDIIAKKFLNILDKSILHKKWAQHYEKFLNDKTLQSEGFIQFKRMQMPEFDYFISNTTPINSLLSLLKQDEDNKMAFEYLIAYYLLERRIGNLLKHLNMFGKLNYHRIPRHIEEVLIFTKALAPSKIDLGEFKFSPQIMENFDKFNTILTQNANDEEKAKESLKKDFQNTFWYYLRFSNPTTTNVQLKTSRIDESIL